MKTDEIALVIEPQRPTPAFVFASWAALAIGLGAYFITLFNTAEMQLNEKGYYVLALFLGVSTAITIQKTVRDKAEGLKITAIYYGLSWFFFGVALIMLTIGLWNAGSIDVHEKTVYAVSMALTLFAIIAIQKNVRDLEAFKTVDAESRPKIPTSPRLGPPKIKQDNI